MKLLILVFLFVVCSNSFAATSNFSVSNQKAVTATGTPAQALAENPYREYLMVQNLGNDSVLIYLNAVSAQGIAIPAGGHWEPSKAPKDIIYVKSASGSQSVLFVDGN